MGFNLPEGAFIAVSLLGRMAIIAASVRPLLFALIQLVSFDQCHRKIHAVGDLGGDARTVLDADPHRRPRQQCRLEQGAIFDLFSLYQKWSPCCNAGGCAAELLRSGLSLRLGWHRHRVG